MINAAIVGLGRWGQNLVKSVQGSSDKIRFVRGVVRHPEAVADFGAAQGFPITDDYAAMVADPGIQAVVLATPHSLHTEQVVAAARAGKAVFCEKPFALKRADAVRAVAACREAGVTLAVGQDKRFWASMQELKRIVSSGVLGRILHLEGNSSNEVSRRHYSPWRGAPGEAPGGSMTATGIHILDGFVNLAGPVARVSAQMQKHEEQGVTDSMAALFNFTSGATGVLCSVRPSPFFWRLHVFGMKGSAEAVGENEIVVRMSGGQPERRELAPVDALRFELEAFADAIGGGPAYPVTPDQMIAVVAAFEAIDASMVHGKPIDIVN